MQTLKKNIRYLLTVHNMSVSDLADRLNISQPSVSKWLQTSSDVIPTVQNLRSISVIFGVSIDTLLAVDLSDPTAEAGGDTVEGKIDSLIMELERLRERIKKSEKGKPKPPKGGIMMCAFLPMAANY